MRTGRGSAKASLPPRRLRARAFLLLSTASLVALAACHAPVGEQPRTPPTSTGCPSSAAGLGFVAYVSHGGLHVVDLATCRDRVIVRAGARPPVAISPTGGWIAFGRGNVVSAAGGPVVRSLGGPASRWEWSPIQDILAGVTPGGGLAVGGPEEPPRQLYPDGSGVREVRFSPDGRRLAVNLYLRRITVVWLATTTRHVAYRITADSPAGLQVAGWSRDGRWILYWLNAHHSSSIAADGLPLMAVPAGGGNPVKIADHLLLYSDFITRCGPAIVAAVGGDRWVTGDKRLVAAEAPGWRAVDLSGDPSRSWFWPACSPDGRWIAATATRNADERRFGIADRTIWLLAADGSFRHHLVGREGDAVADEAPRWSRDGRWLLFVERERRPDAPGTLVLARVKGTSATVAGPVATLPGGVGYYGHYDWLKQSDWYQPEG